jgi:RNA polymerase sigma-70 factor (ECF subfamily)
MRAGIIAFTAIDNNHPGSADRDLLLEQRLLARAKAGDSEAFEILMVRYQHQVLGTALRLLGNQEDACDAAQEVFFRFYKYRRTLQPGRGISAWLYRITVNVCLDLGRRRRGGSEVSLDEKRSERGFDPVSSQDLEKSLVLSEERRILRDALATLPEKARAALVLRDLQGLETGEVARILGVSEVTVRSHISIARVRIKKYRDRILRRRP